MDAIGLLAALSGCGKDKQGAEDFALEVHKSPSDVVEAIAHLDFSAKQAVFSSLVITTSRDEIVYIMSARDLPDRSVGKSVIALTLEPTREGLPPQFTPPSTFRPCACLWARPTRN